MVCSTFSFGQNESISITVNTDTVTFGQSFELILTVENIKGDLEVPKLDDFIITSGPNTSTQMQWINGNFSNSKTLKYYLSPKKLGECSIDKAGIRHNGKIIETEEMTIICVSEETSHNNKLDSTPFLQGEKSSKSVLSKAKRHKT